MQKNIDMYFKSLNPSKKNESKVPNDSATKKRKALIISSDEEDLPDSSKPVKSYDNKRVRTDNKRSSSTKPSLSKLKSSPQKKRPHIDPQSLFGGETLRVEKKKQLNSIDKITKELEEDDINKALLEIKVEEENGISMQPTKSPIKSSPKNAKDKIKTPKSNKKSPRNEKLNISENLKEVSPPSAKKQKIQKRETSVEKKKSVNSPKVNETNEDLDNSIIITDEDRHARKRMSAMLYQKYKNRSSCLNHGSKEVPKGKPNCLAGLNFLVTGVLESMERDETTAIIKEYGGKVMTTVGKRLNYLIVGEDAGPKKLAQADEYNIKILSEDGFFDLIREKSGDVVPEQKISLKSPKNKLSEDKIIKTEILDSSLLKTPKLEKPNFDTEYNGKKAAVKERDVKSTEAQDIKGLSKPVVKIEPDENALAWVDKYKPKSIKEIVGQHGAASNVTKLTNWLTKWYENHNGKKKLQKPNPWAKNDDGSFYKAALLSGSPGVGKTTTANLVCKELGFDAVEFNASDTRSKRLLKEEVAELLSNKSLYGYCHGNAQAVTKKHVLIMDEVDGMAGNEDRGGIQELIGLIKDSSVPIICMCNDRNHTKMRSLVNYCYDLRFNKPRLQQIKGFIMSICHKENFKIEPAKIEEIIAATNNDIRQSINHLSLLSAGKELNLKSNTLEKEKIAAKDLKLGPWDVVRKIFSVDEHKVMNLQDKCDLFFHDYSLGPLFVQQNYLQVSPAGSKSEIITKVALTADALSLGDLVDKRIRSDSAWSLLPTQAIFSSVMPGEFMCGHLTGQVNFPGWLGKYSRANRRKRLAQEIHDHTRIRTSGSRQSIRLDYAPYLLSNIVRPMKEFGLEGVEISLNVLKEYHLLREDIESLIELTAWPGKKSLMDAIDGRIKAAFTRNFNKEMLAYSYSATVGVKKKRADAVEDDLLSQEVEIVESDDEDANKLENDGLIKIKKRPTKTTSSNGSKSNASTAKKPAGSGGSKAKATKAKK